MILGIDEVGRGPWAGPLVVGAVVLGEPIDGLTDSKKLTAKRRTELDIVIRHKSSGIGLGWVHPVEIDEVGLSRALELATIRAVAQIDVPYHEIIIDGTVNFLKDTGKGRYVTTLKKADLLIAAVSAASIVAKVARDSYMIEQDPVYPDYGFKSHVGYGTALHQQAIQQFGVTPLHRRSFAPVATAAKAQAGTTKEIGDTAEDVAAAHLKQRGHKILIRNWKTKICEIDIVSQKHDTIFFTEVKYRRKPDQGGGLAAITQSKLRQMKFAAEYFALSHNIKDLDLRLSAMSLSGTPSTVDTYLESV